MKKNKTIGILSMQRVPNYGSFMQAWALKEMLRQQGAEDVSFIDIRRGRSLHGYEPAKTNIFARGVRIIWSIFTLKIRNKVKDRRFYQRLQACYDDKFYDMLGLNDPKPNHYDLAVIGSDEVFNCCQPTPWGYTQQLYGDIPEADTVATYAASFGNTTYDNLREQGISGEIAETMKKLSAISVRDENSYKIVLKLTGRHAIKHLDPVLVYDFSKETAGITAAKNSYLLVYAYNGRLSKDETDAIKRFAKQHDKEVVTLMCRIDGCETIIPDTPFEVLAWFKGADFVVTDTFHGTIFSVITHSNFCTFVRDSNRNKLGYLLDSLHLATRQAGSINDMNAVLASLPDYTETDKTLMQAQRDTAQYLNDLINNKFD